MEELRIEDRVDDLEDEIEKLKTICMYQNNQIEMMEQQICDLNMILKIQSEMLDIVGKRIFPLRTIKNFFTRRK